VFEPTTNIGYFLAMARAVAEWSTCERSKVGSVITDYTGRVISVGFNRPEESDGGCWDCPRRRSGATPGLSSYESGATRCSTVHAEQAAILRRGESDSFGDCIFITRKPCYNCFEAIRHAGITKVFWGETAPYELTPPEKTLYTLSQIQEWLSQVQADRLPKHIHAPYTTMLSIDPDREDHIIRGEN
jgi:dCMP deaminase